MKWRAMVELTGNDGIVRLHEVSAGGTNTIECSAGMVGLTHADGISRETWRGRSFTRSFCSNRVRIVGCRCPRMP
jgi:hypothetical protein